MYNTDIVTIELTVQIKIKNIKLLQHLAGHGIDSIKLSFSLIKGK